MVINLDVINEILDKLSKSTFRTSFKLNKKEIDYINKNSIDTIKNHAYDIVRKRLAPKVIENDGQQTPTKNHPVFIAQHATATCCRGCLYKWHHINKNKELNEIEIKYIVNVIMIWILRQMEE